MKTRKWLILSWAIRQYCGGMAIGSTNQHNFPARGVDAILLLTPLRLRFVSFSLRLNTIINNVEKTTQVFNSRQRFPNYKISNLCEYANNGFFTN